MKIGNCTNEDFDEAIDLLYVSGNIIHVSRFQESLTNKQFDQIDNIPNSFDLWVKEIKRKTEKKVK